MAATKVFDRLRGVYVLHEHPIERLATLPSTDKIYTNKKI